MNKVIARLSQEHSWLTLLAMAGLSMLLAGCTGLNRRLIYYPVCPPSAELDQLAMSAGLMRWTNSAGQNIGWKRMSPVQPACGQVLVTHGNAGCAVRRGDYAHILGRILGLDVFILEYPGFGDRPGLPSEQTLFDSAEDALRSLPPAKAIYLLGESLGTGVAAYLAGMHPVDVAGILLIAPYRSLDDVARYHAGTVSSMLLREHFRAEEYLRDYRGPVGILVANNDRVVPAESGYSLYRSYPGPKRLWESAEANHQTLRRQPPSFWEEVGEFWQRALTDEQTHRE